MLLSAPLLLSCGKGERAVCIAAYEKATVDVLKAESSEDLLGISYALIPLINLVLHHFTGDIPLNAALDPKTALFLIILSVILTLIGGLIPARSASKKDPVISLRSE